MEMEFEKSNTDMCGDGNTRTLGEQGLEKASDKGGVQNVPPSEGENVKNYGANKTSTVDVTLQDVMVFLQKLSTQVESIDRTNSVILSSLVKLVIRDTRGDNTGTPQHGQQNKEVEHKSQLEEDTCHTRKQTLDESKSNKSGEGQMKQAGEKEFDLSTIILDVSDDEGENKKRTGGLKSSFTRQTLPDSRDEENNNILENDYNYFMVEDRFDDLKPFASNYRGGLQSKVRGDKPDIPHPSAVAKKLSFTPTPRANKRQRTTSMPTPTSAKKQSTTISPQVDKFSKGKDVAYDVNTSAFSRAAGVLIPKHAKCRFKPSLDMRLSDAEGRICHYVFHTELQQSEEILIVGNNTGTRADFHSLCPGRLLHREILLFMALKVTWTQLNKPNKTVWCLPPAFAADALSGASIEDMHNFYGSDWLHPFEHLKLIYIPIEEEGHFYLMVIAIEEKKIYHLDSHLPNDKVQTRRYTIRDLSITLASMILVVYPPEQSLQWMADFGNWKIIEPRGVPNCGNSDNSGLWVVEWMRMENLFSNNVPGVMNEKKVRMKLTMNLLLGAHNENMKVLLEKAGAKWKKMMTSSPQTSGQH